MTACAKHQPKREKDPIALCVCIEQNVLPAITIPELQKSIRDGLMSGNHNDKTFRNLLNKYMPEPKKGMSAEEIFSSPEMKKLIKIVEDFSVPMMSCVMGKK